MTVGPPPMREPTGDKGLRENRPDSLTGRSAGGDVGRSTSGVWRTAPRVKVTGEEDRGTLFRVGKRSTSEVWKSTSGVWKTDRLPKEGQTIKETPTTTVELLRDQTCRRPRGTSKGFKSLFRQMEV